MTEEVRIFEVSIRTHATRVVRVVDSEREPNESWEDAGHRLAIEEYYVSEETDSEVTEVVDLTAVRPDLVAG